MAIKPKTLILRTAGTNCDGETAHAFERAGATAEMVHINRLLKDPRLLDAYQLLAIPGGFSYGDDISAGRILANQIVHHLGDAVRAFIDSGRPVIGICNGFQVLCEAKLLPGALIRNKDLKFHCEHIRVRVDETDTPFTLRATRGQVLRIPIAHGEGNYFADPETLEQLESSRRVVLRYCDEKGQVSDASNPNGSVRGIAGICNEARNIVGLMPHPERACESTLGSQDGLVFFDSVVASLASRGALTA